MTNFNINNSKVEQLNDTGDNVKVVGNSGNIVMSDHGDVIQATGHDIKVKTEKGKEGLWSMLVKKIKAVGTWFIGLFGS